MSAALLDHLWQSTLFAICAWSLAWVLRKNGAHLPVAALVDQFYAEVQKMGGKRWDTSSLLARLER